MSTSRSSPTRIATLLVVPAILLAACAQGVSEGSPTSTTTGTTTGSSIAAGSEQGSNLGEVTVAVGAAQSIDFAAAELGLELGVWKKRGLTVNNVFVRGGGEVARTVASGDAQIGMTTGPAAVAPIIKGLPARLVAATSLDWVGFVIIVAANSEIQTIADLKGKTIGFTRPGSTTDYVADQIAASQGWMMGEDISKASIGGLQEMVAALNSGAIDAFTWTAEPAYTLEEQGEARVIGDMGDIIGPNVFVSAYATIDLIDNQPEIVQAFLEGWMETQRWMKENPDEAIDWMANKWEMSKTAIAKAFETAGPNLSTTGEIPEANLAGLAKTVAELDEEIPSPPAPDEFFDPRFLPVNTG